MRTRFNPGHATGILDKVIGLNKEIVGELFDREALKKAGQLQQEKGAAKLSALQAEAKADTAKAKAKSLDEAQQKADSAS
jgi:uncharacterized protein YjbJ (UPF0337 family)